MYLRTRLSGENLSRVEGSLANGGSRPLDKRGGGGGGGWGVMGAGLRKFFSALRASVWCKNKGGGGGADPSPGSATACLPELPKVSQLFIHFRSKRGELFT